MLASLEFSLSNIVVLVVVCIVALVLVLIVTRDSKNARTKSAKLKQSVVNGNQAEPQLGNQFAEQTSASQPSPQSLSESTPPVSLEKLHLSGPDHYTEGPNHWH